jgi:hypothetical protein
MLQDMAKTFALAQQGNGICAVVAGTSPLSLSLAFSLSLLSLSLSLARLGADTQLHMRRRIHADTQLQADTPLSRKLRARWCIEKRCEEAGREREDA